MEVLGKKGIQDQKKVTKKYFNGRKSYREKIFLVDLN